MSGASAAGAAAAAPVEASSSDEDESAGSCERSRSPKRLGGSRKRDRESPERDAGAAASGASVVDDSLADPLEERIADVAIPGVYTKKQLCTEEDRHLAGIMELPYTPVTWDSAMVDTSDAVEHLRVFMNQSGLPGDDILRGVRMFPGVVLAGSAVLWAVLKASGDEPAWIPGDIDVFDMTHPAHDPAVYHGVHRYFKGVLKEFKEHPKPAENGDLYNGMCTTFEREGRAVRVQLIRNADIADGRELVSTFDLDIVKLYCDGMAMHISCEAAVAMKQNIMGVIGSTVRGTMLLPRAYFRWVKYAKRGFGGLPQTIVGVYDSLKGRPNARLRNLPLFEFDLEGYAKTVYHASDSTNIVYVVFEKRTGQKTKAARVS